MAAIALQMRTLSSKARALTASVRDDTRKREESDLEVRIAAWKQREKEKAKNAIARLPAFIKDLAEKGKSQLIVQVEVTSPYVGSDIGDTYKVLSRFDFPSLLEFEVPKSHFSLSLYMIRNLRYGARMIARWALKEGFTVHFYRWEDRIERENVQHYDFFDVDKMVTPVFVESRNGGWPVCEGFMISW